MNLIARSLTSLLFVLAVAGCREPLTDINCAGVGRPAFLLTLQHALAGVDDPFIDVLAVATEGTFSDTARVAAYSPSDPDKPLIWLASDRAGRYDVEVSAQGFDTWQAKGLIVSADVCGEINTRALTVSLQPAS